MLNMRQMRWLIPSVWEERQWAPLCEWAYVCWPNFEWLPNGGFLGRRRINYGCSTSLCLFVNLSSLGLLTAQEAIFEEICGLSMASEHKFVDKCKCRGGKLNLWTRRRPWKCHQPPWKTPRKPIAQRPHSLTLWIRTFDRRVDTLRFRWWSKSIGRHLGHAPAPAAALAARLDAPALAGAQRTQGVPPGPLRVAHSATSLHGPTTEDDDHDPAVDTCGERRGPGIPQLREFQLGLRRNRLLRTLCSRGAQCQCLRQDQKYYIQKSCPCLLVFLRVPLSLI